MANSYELENAKLKNICCACLSSERKLSPLHSMSDGDNKLFSLLSHYSDLHQEVPAHTAHHCVCWECRAVLRRLSSFRDQVCTAQKQLAVILDDKHEIDANKECLSKLSYNYKRSFDKELVYSNAPTNEQPGIYIKTDEIPGSSAIKTELNQNNGEEDSNPFPEIELRNADNGVTKEENDNTKVYVNIKGENEIQDGDKDGGNGFVTIEIQTGEIQESVPKKRFSKRNINVAKKIKTVDKKINLSSIEKGVDKENDKVPKEAQKLPTAPKTRSRRVQKKKEESNYPCSDCEEVFTAYMQRYEHILKQHKEGHQCCVCGKKFHIKKSFLRHERVHKAKTLPLEKCPTCDKLVRSDLLQAHVDRHARKDSANYECVPCKKRFANKNSYKKHLTEAKVHLPTDTEKKYECESCHKWFPTLLLYNCHMRYTKRHAAHAAVYKYKCSMCARSFRNPAALRDHVNYVHMGKTQHKCSVCDKALASPQCVARHMKRYHGGYKDPKNKLCVTCGKAFSTKRELREHESVHTGERPLKCDACGDTFRQSGALYTHRRRVHRVPPRRSVQLVAQPDELVERLVRAGEQSESELLINRVLSDNK